MRGVLALLALLVLWVPACAPTVRAPGEARDLTGSLAASAGMVPVTLDQGGFRLTGYFKNGDGQDLVVYIEGDGRAWANRKTPSDDPTPRDPLVLRLAMADPAPKVLYLARPCQFASASSPGCTPDLWTQARYGQTVVSSLLRALDQAKDLTGATRLHLVGYSGGGALAVLVAGQRQDVADILTVAANLDTEAWTRYHAISPLSASLNPADRAALVRDIPQTHLRGAGDRVIPGLLCERFLDRMGRPPTARCLEASGVDHSQGLEVRWRDILAAHRRFAESLAQAASRTGPAR